MDPNEPVAVYETTDPGEAEALRLALDAEGIDCQIEGGHQAGLTGILRVRLLVPSKDAARAREVLKERQ